MDTQIVRIKDNLHQHKHREPWFSALRVQKLSETVMQTCNTISHSNLSLYGMCNVAQVFWGIEAQSYQRHSFSLLLLILLHTKNIDCFFLGKKMEPRFWIPVITQYPALGLPVLPQGALFPAAGSGNNNRTAWQQASHQTAASTAMPGNCCSTLCSQNGSCVTV